MAAGGVLFSEMTPDASWETEFNAWYDGEHIPLRMEVPGFLGAQRYRRRDSSAYLAVYDLESPAVLTSAAYDAVKSRPTDLTRHMLSSVSGFTRYIGELTSARLQPGLRGGEELLSPVLYAVMFTVPAQRSEEFDAWYDEDHMPTLLECKEWLGCRRYAIVDGEPEAFTHLALHHLATADALDSPSRSKARNSEWRRKLAAEPWFKGSYSVFDRLGRRFQPTIPNTGHHD